VILILVAAYRETVFSFAGWWKIVGIHDEEGDVVGGRPRRRGDCLGSRSPGEHAHAREQWLGGHADPGGRGICDRGNTQLERWDEGCIRRRCDDPCHWVSHGTRHTGIEDHPVRSVSRAWGVLYLAEQRDAGTGFQNIVTTGNPCPLPCERQISLRTNAKHNP